ncbi:zinc finger BED domain-containing protein RICESLEEPER 2-like [Coffea arabica]|uniref:Zinc finger BED domain-containing protein RICESLEEPER 2-like n=1 Tax=Coffea arabica TaxID=13443 RepID=A0ABM4W5M6_COFAR
MVAQQTKLNFQPADEIFSTLSALHTGKFDMEEEGFNIMMRWGMPEWQKISRRTAKYDCVTVYKVEKNKLKNKLKHVQKVSITTDLWKSKNQKIEYVVITGHWIDSNWKLQKRILNFVCIPPPRRGVEIAAAIFKCAKEWEIVHKIHTISVDNASNNDVAIRLLKDDFSRSKKLLCGDGLSKIVDITNNIRESVEFVNRSEGRALLFAEIAQQLRIPGKKMLYDCRTRWNATSRC